MSPVGEELGEVLLVVGHAGLLREEEDQQQLQEWQHVDPLAALTSEPLLATDYYECCLWLILKVVFWSGFVNRSANI